MTKLIFNQALYFIYIFFSSLKSKWTHFLFLKGRYWYLVSNVQAKLLISTFHDPRQFLYGVAGRKSVLRSFWRVCTATGLNWLSVAKCLIFLNIEFINFGFGVFHKMWDGSNYEPKLTVTFRNIYYANTSASILLVFKIVYCIYRIVYGIGETKASLCGQAYRN